MVQILNFFYNIYTVLDVTVYNWKRVHQIKIVIWSKLYYISKMLTYSIAFLWVDCFKKFKIHIWRAEGLQTKQAVSVHSWYQTTHPNAGELIVKAGMIRGLGDYAMKPWSFTVNMPKDKSKYCTAQGKNLWKCAVNLTNVRELGLIRNSVFNFSRNTIIASCWTWLLRLSQLFSWKR
jgi:hypothetical protein